jgi:hypothetical protein
VLSLAGCTDASSQPAPAPTVTRSFAQGFTDFPSARSLPAVIDAFEVIARDGDLAVMHFDDGVPWDEALAGAPYPSWMREELVRKAALIPRGHRTYLALTPIAFERDRLASRRGPNGSEALEPPWSQRGFDDPSVVAAFVAHCERMIARFEPDFFAYAVEANMLAQLAPERWEAFVALAARAYPAVKAAHPELPVFVTLQADFYHANPAAQAEAIRQVLPFTDLIAVSTYPFTRQPDPALLRRDHFAAVAALAPEKPFAVAETAWPAEPVTAPYPVGIPATEETQRAYVTRLLAEAGRLEAVFVTWFFTRDYDELWESDIRHLPNASLLRLWKDTGLYAGDGRPRPALTEWRRYLGNR